ncbi:glycoside hydrolase family 31 protein [bacterium]|nr:MAG: glycoside hydrolase family 31 protein [bacterium]
MKTPSNILLPVGLAIVLSAPFSAIASAQDQAPLVLQVNAVDSSTYHLVFSSQDAPKPPLDPFTVLKSNWSGSKSSKAANGPVVKAKDSTLTVDAGGSWKLDGQGTVGAHLSGTVSLAPSATTFTLKHPVGERFYGAGNQYLDNSGSLMHATDSQLTLNGATRVPFLWSTGGYSIFIANNVRGTSWEDKDGTLTFTIPAPYADVFLSTAPDGYGLLDGFSRLTGRAPIPPRWTFGFMMSRWGYQDAADVQDKWQQFRDRKIPVDTFIYDYDWFTNDWEFNPKTFPAGTLDQMDQKGLKFVGIRKPRVNGANLEFAKKQGWMLTGTDWTDLRFDIPAANAWWWSHQAPLVKAGADGWWNDEAEQSMDEFMQMCRVQWDGWRSMSPRRAWTINRAFSPGMQRYGAATWTGDINTRWDVLQNQPGIMLNWALAGMPYTSQDNGGFHGKPTPEMYTRWLESSVFTPIMRSHSTLNSDRWPWAFGPEAEAAIKKAIELRYRLIPYLYTFAAANERTGAPLMRPLLLEFPQDEKTFDLRDEWLFGDRLLAAPILAEGGKRDVYLPAGGWFDFNTGATVNGGQTFSIEAPLDTIPAYVRAGTILPLGPIVQSTSLGPVDPLEVRIYPGADASFSLYEDDGDNYDYEKGAFTRIPMTWNDKTRIFSVGKRSGSYPGMLAIRNLTVVLPTGEKKQIVYNGQTARVKF